MNPFIGWALAAVFLAVAWQQYGWQGALFAASVIVFWLLLQFNRAVRVMKNASSAPVGHVDSAVMLHARMKPRLTLMQLLGMTHSLGRKVSDAPERYEWTDASGATLAVDVRNGRCTAWELRRDGGAPAPEPDADASA